MKITRAEAILLSKILFHYEQLTDSYLVDSLAQKLDDFLGETKDAQDEGFETQSKAVDDETHCARTRSLSKEESVPSSGHGDPVEQEGETLDEILAGEFDCLGSILARVVSSVAGDPDARVSIDFESAGDELVVYVDEHELSPVELVKREYDKLYIAESSTGTRCWHKFQIEVHSMNAYVCDFLREGTMFKVVQPDNSTFAPSPVDAWLVREEQKIDRLEQQNKRIKKKIV